MTLTRNLFLAGAILAVGGFAATPASAMLITHSVDGVLAADDLQSYNVDEQPGGNWHVSYADRGEYSGSDPNIFPNPTADSHFASEYAFLHTIDSGSPGAPTVAKGGVDGHTKYLDLINEDASESRIWAHYSFPDVNSGSLHVEYMVLWSASNANFEMTIDSRDPGAFTPGDRDDVLVRLRLIAPEDPNDGDFELAYNVPPDIPDTRTGLFVNVGEWHKMEIDITWDAIIGDTFTVSIDGQTSSAFATNAPDGATANLVSFNHTRDHMYLGSVVPEPASVALMGLGGLLMLRRRRKSA